MSEDDASPPPSVSAATGNKASGASRLTMTRGALTAIGSAAVLLFAGVVWVAYNAGVERGTRAEPPIVRAEPGADKIRPGDPGGREFAHQDKTVYDVLDGTGENVEQLLPQAEEPMQKPRIVAGGQPNAGGQRNRSPGPKIIRIPQPPAGESAARPAPPPAPEPPVLADPMGDAPAAPRTETPARAETLAPAETLAAPEVLTAPEVLAAPDVPAAPPLVAPATVPPIMKLPASPPASEAPPVIEELAVKKPVASPPARKIVRATKQYVVQLGAFRTPEAGQAGWKLLLGKHAAQLGSLQHFVTEADLGARGKFYRLQAGPFAVRADAVSACESLKLAGGDCLVVSR